MISAFSKAAALHWRSKPGAPSVGATILRVCLLVLVAAVAIGVDVSRPKTDFTVNNLGYNFATAPAYSVHTPVQFATHFDLKFDALADDSAPGDAIQSSGLSGPALEFQVRRPKQLVMLLFQMYTPITLTQNFALHRWHHVHMHKYDDGRFDVTLDGVTKSFSITDLKQSQSSASIGWKDFAFRFGTIEVGGGAAPWRGKIANLSFTSQYVVPVPWLAAFAGEVAIGIVLLWVLLPWLANIPLPQLSRTDTLVFASTAGGAVVGFTAYLLHLPAGKWAILLAAGAGAVAGTVAAIQFRIALGVPRRIRRLLVPLLIIIAASSLLTLPNWLTTMRMFWRWPFISMVIVTLTLCAAALVTNSWLVVSKISGARRWFAFLPYVIFALLAIRCDSLVAPINALHWDYVLGPIRALREGGWLLWDVPSQYGFLNVLIPTLLPIHPVMEAFYCFQAFTFFAASSILYRTLYVVLRVRWWLAALLAVSFFFFADPLLIGPAPYPSMSSVRFLWCYILLAIAATVFFGERPSIDRFVRYGTVAWIAGLLWSAESAIYTTVIFFTPVLISILRSRRDPLSLRQTPAAKLIGIPIVLAASAFCLINLIYLIYLGHEPDWSMYIMYIVSYGSGFGEIYIPFYGPFGIILLIFASGAAAFVMMQRRAEPGAAYAIAAAFALTWIVSTYYLGRAFPVVITTLFPLILFAAFVIIRGAAAAYRPPLLAALITPLIALAWVSAFWNADMPGVAPSLVKPSVNAWSHFPSVNPELKALLAKTGIEPNTSIVYYDTWIAMPRADNAPFDRNWLPTPLGQLEDPIPTDARNRIISRFVMRHRMSGYFIQALGDANVPETAQSWIDLLSSYYNIKEIAHSEHYRVLYFSIRNPAKRGGLG